MNKGQNRGHCQVCGRIQVVLPNGLVAKHGYRVAGFGFFSGVCFGSRHQPLQIERLVTDQIMANLVSQAQSNEVRAMALRGGMLNPEQAQKLEFWGSRVWKWVGEGRMKAREPVMVPWSDASAEERERQIELEAGECEMFARHARSHVKSLGELIAKVHGQPLIDRDQEELDKVAVRTAKKAPIEGAYRTKQAQKDDLERLNREFSKLSQAMQAVGVYYMDIPFDLHNFNQNRLSKLMHQYGGTDAKNLFLEAAGLYAARVEIKSRPVIK
jgi:hypothetical protein